MKTKLRAAIGMVLASIAMIGAAAMPASSQATDVGIMAQPGQICYIHAIYGNAPVYNLNQMWVEYWLAPGSAFRILGYAGADYRGRGNGMPEGYLYRPYIDQASCTW